MGDDRARRRLPPGHAQCLLLRRLPGRLDAAGLHRWRPIAPCARVEVALRRPALRWSGAGYWDSNAGAAPLEDTFTRWDWSRASVGNDTVVLYDTAERGGARRSLAVRYDPAGEAANIALPPEADLPRTGWRIARATRCEPDRPASVVQTLEDAPFYARSLVATSLLGERVTAVHEGLSLDRFRQGWVQMMLPFKMPRRGRSPRDGDASDPTAT